MVTCVAHQPSLSLGYPFEGIPGTPVLISIWPTRHVADLHQYLRGVQPFSWTISRCLVGEK